MASVAATTLLAEIKKHGRITGFQLLKIMETLPTPRPVLDLNVSYNDALGETREAILRWRTRSPPALTSAAEKIVEDFRKAQVKKIGRIRRCSTETAVEAAEDPSPYDTEHLFYCLTPPK
jgi:hypothetical protein